MSGHGMQATIDRVEKQNVKLRQDFAARMIEKMGLDPTSGPAMLLMYRYRPTDHGFEVEEVQAWLDEVYAGAVFVDGEEF